MDSSREGLRRRGDTRPSSGTVAFFLDFFAFFDSRTICAGAARAVADGGAGAAGCVGAAALGVSEPE